MIFLLSSDIVLTSKIIKQFESFGKKKIIEFWKWEEIL
jgi:hypothetical protein